MKHTLFLIVILASIRSFAQPQAINYQGVARDAQGRPLVNKIISLRLSILDSTANGASLYVETHQVTTTSSGLYNTAIGNGIPVAGSFTAIPWGQGDKWLKTEMDSSGGSNYQLIGTSQFLSVPYALQSTNATNAANGLPPGGGQGQVITMCEGVPIWTDNGQCPAVIAALNCAAAINTGDLVSGFAADSVSSTIPYSGGNGGAFSSHLVPSTGVTGLTATLSAGTILSGSGVVNYIISGTPSDSGTAYFALSLGGQFCTLIRTVGAGVSGISTATCGATNVLNPANTYGSLTDQDGNLYKTVIIGMQEWMAENLKVSHYRNGDLIPVVTDGATWSGLSTGATCWYNNDSTNYNCPYGKLYNWFAVDDSRNLCPIGWHVPSDAEWAVLEDYLGGSSIAGGKLKSTDTLYWTSPNIGANNNSGWSGLPGGFQSYFGSFSGFGFSSYWWSSTEYLSSAASQYMSAYSESIYKLEGIDKRVGFSIRCLRD